MSAEGEGYALLTRLRAAYPEVEFALADRESLSIEEPDAPAQVIVIHAHDMTILDPCASENGFERIDPSYYGISMTDALAIRAHNVATLVGVPAAPGRDSLALQLSALWVERVRGFFDAEQADDVLALDRFSVCGRECMRVAQLADFVFGQWPDAIEEVQGAALQQIGVIVFG